MKYIYIIISFYVLLVGCASTKKTPPPTPPKTDNKVPPPVSSNNNTSINGRWKFESSSDKKFEQDNVKTLPELSFNDASRKVTGSIGCNSLNGFFFITGKQFNFSPLALTKKTCSNEPIESYLKSFFKNVGFYKTDGNKLYLIDKSDTKRYVVFTK